jgi:hypothetical protein
MPILDFKEISPATGGATRDQYELFAREFLESLGFKILVGPNRGADAGRDLVAEEVRTGVAGETRVKWLVSCKHKAHSGASVTPDDERDIHDRVRTHSCDGFLGVYSTVPSSGLAAKLNAPELPFEVLIFDQERIETQLLTASGLPLAKRFFPVSFHSWEKEHPRAASIFSDEPALDCWHCNKSLLQPKPHGIVVTWSSLPDDQQPRATKHVYWCCKGQCDRALKARYRTKGLIDGWEDIPDILAPIAYIRWVVVTLNQFQSGVTMSEEAFASTKQLLLNLFPLVARDMTAKEKERISELSAIPSYLGGWGYD